MGRARAADLSRSVRGFLCHDRLRGSYRTQEDVVVSPTRSRISPIILVYEAKRFKRFLVPNGSGKFRTCSLMVSLSMSTSLKPDGLRSESGHSNVPASTYPVSHASFRKFERYLGYRWRTHVGQLSAEIGILLPNNQRQHSTLHIQEDVLPYALC